MYLKKDPLTLSEIKRLSISARTIISLLWIGLLFVFWNIQVIKHHDYTNLAVKNITRRIDMKAPRGLILDRQGHILAENKIDFSLLFERENVVDISWSIQRASELTDRSPEQISKIIKRYRKYPGFFQIPIQNNLSMEKVIYFLSRKDLYPEFQVGVEPMRSFPNGSLASHLLGYIAEITQEEMRQSEYLGYQLGDRIGRSGLEKSFEKNLSGQKGYQLVIKDSIEKIHQVDEINKPQIGDTLHLTIDLYLQEYIEKLLDEKKGVIAVVDLASGGLLALSSKPDFSPEFFTSSFDSAEWSALANDPDNPLQNRFIQGRYPPGSTFKIVVALAALQENIVNQQTTFFCSGGMQIYDRYFNCWNRFGHASVNITAALSHSCNVFFYQMGKRLDIDDIARYAVLLGLQNKTDIELPHESGGLVPSSEWKMKTFNQKWFPGETISAAIGQGSISVTPAQMLTMISTVALRGRKPRLHLVQRIERRGEIVFSRKYQDETVPISENHFETVVRGLYAAVNQDGTARSARIDGLEICGKTGTAQVIARDNPNYKTLIKQKRFQPHSWFVSFAPRDNPRIAMLVLIENGGDGGAAAAPLSRKIYDYYFNAENRL